MSKKRDQQRQVKEQKQKVEQQKAETQKLLLKIGTFVVAPLFALLVLYSLFSQGPTYSTVEIVDTDHLRGAESNPVSIVVYADFQCPPCATENRTMTQLWPEIRHKAKLIFRHFPLTSTHPNAWTAALYAEAAARQNSFWQMHDYMFATQSAWSGLSDVEAEFESYALQLNLDIEQLRADAASDEVLQKVRSDKRSGISAGVRSTPTLFINGRQIARPTRARILDVVNEEFDNAAA
jgi:protein-disulfide isomerase